MAMSPDHPEMPTGMLPPGQSSSSASTQASGSSPGAPSQAFTRQSRTAGAGGEVEEVVKGDEEELHTPPRSPAEEAGDPDLANLDIANYAVPIYVTLESLGDCRGRGVVCVCP